MRFPHAFFKYTFIDPQGLPYTKYDFLRLLPPFFNIWTFSWDRTPRVRVAGVAAPGSRHLMSPTCGAGQGRADPPSHTRGPWSEGKGGWRGAE